MSTKEQLLWFEALVHREYTPVRSVCAHLVVKAGMDASYGDDLVQEVFYLARVKLDSLSHHPNPKAWLYKTAYYALRGLARKQLATRLSDEVLSELADPQAEFAMTAWMPSDQAELVEEAVNGLSAADQLLFYRMFSQHLDAPALCAAYRASRDAMRKRVYRMYKRLTKNLQKTAENF